MHKKSFKNYFNWLIPYGFFYVDIQDSNHLFPNYRITKNKIKSKELVFLFVECHFFFFSLRDCFNHHNFVLTRNVETNQISMEVEELHTMIILILNYLKVQSLHKHTINIVTVMTNNILFAMI
jgi:hypothetical protein